MKLLKSSTSFKQRNNHEMSCDQNFCMKIFTTPNSKDLIETLSIVAINRKIWVGIPSYVIISCQ